MASGRVLVVDDEPDIRSTVKEILEDEGYQVSLAASAAAARDVRTQIRPDVILLDIWMPELDGISLLREWAGAGALTCPVIMMSGHGTVETAVEATRLGAYDFVEKPISLAKLLLTIERAREASRLKRENEGLRAQLALPLEPVGSSKSMAALRAQLDKLAQHETSILIQGEAGTGKETLARWLHARSSRRSGAFVAVAPGSIPREHLVVALFGAEDSSGVQPGLLEQANGGTLFLDEVAELDPELQQRLSSVLERRALVRSGGAGNVALDLRVIAATAQNLEAQVKAGLFREELYYLLNVVPLAVPPLRKRSEDVPELLRLYADFFASRDKLPYRQFPVAVQNRLRNLRLAGQCARAAQPRAAAAGHGQWRSGRTRRGRSRARQCGATRAEPRHHGARCGVEHRFQSAAARSARAVRAHVSVASVAGRWRQCRQAWPRSSAWNARTCIANCAILAWMCAMWRAKSRSARGRKRSSAELWISFAGLGYFEPNRPLKEDELMSVKGKVALVTGAASGIGKRIAEVLCGQRRAYRHRRHQSGGGRSRRRPRSGRAASRRPRS